MTEPFTSAFIAEDDAVLRKVGLLCMFPIRAVHFEYTGLRGKISIRPLIWARLTEKPN